MNKRTNTILLLAASILLAFSSVSWAASGSLTITSPSDFYYVSPGAYFNVSGVAEISSDTTPDCECQHESCSYNDPNNPSKQSFAWYHENYGAVHGRVYYSIDGRPRMFAGSGYVTRHNSGISTHYYCPVDTDWVSPGPHSVTVYLQDDYSVSCYDPSACGGYCSAVGRGGAIISQQTFSFYVCGPGDPCCGPDPDPCCFSGGECCGSTDACCGAGECCGSDDPACCNNPCCGDMCCDGFGGGAGGGGGGAGGGGGGAGGGGGPGPPPPVDGY